MSTTPAPGEQRRDPAGRARPNFEDPDPRTGDSQDQERPEDRDNVGTVKPEDYPLDRPR